MAVWGSTTKGQTWNIWRTQTDLISCKSRQDCYHSLFLFLLDDDGFVCSGILFFFSFWWEHVGDSLGLLSWPDNNCNSVYLYFCPFEAVFSVKQEPCKGEHPFEVKAAAISEQCKWVLSIQPSVICRKSQGLGEDFEMLIWTVTSLCTFKNTADPSFMWKFWRSPPRLSKMSNTNVKFHPNPAANKRQAKRSEPL